MTIGRTNESINKAGNVGRIDAQIGFADFQVTRVMVAAPVAWDNGTHGLNTSDTLALFSHGKARIKYRVELSNEFMIRSGRIDGCTPKL